MSTATSVPSVRPVRLSSHDFVRPASAAPSGGRSSAAPVGGMVNPNALRLIDGGKPSGISLSPPGPQPASAAGVEPGTATTHANQTGQDKAKAIMNDVGAVLGYQKQIEAAARLADRLGNAAVKIGKLQIKGAQKCWEVTKNLWKKSSWGKLGAIFTGLATGLLYALGGLFYGLGKVLSWIAWPLKRFLGADKNDKKKAKDGGDKTNKLKALDKKEKAAKQKLAAALAELKQAPPRVQKAAVAELNRVSGLDGSRRLDKSERDAVVALLEAGASVGFAFDSADPELLPPLPAGERGAVAALIP